MSAIATLLNLSPRRVQQLAQAGAIPVARKGRYALVASVQGYSRYLQRAAAERNGGASEHAVEVLRQRARRLRWENEAAAEQVIPARDAAIGVQVAADHICSRMLGIPKKAAPAVLAAESVGAVKEILTEYVHAALDELSRTRFVAVSDDEVCGPSRKPARRRGKTRP